MVIVLRLKVITDYTDRGLHKLVRIYAKVQLAELVASVPLEHYYFRWCGTEVSRADEVGQLACPPEFVQKQENPVLF